MRARGFTLVEMLISLAIFGMLSAATVGVLNASLRSKSALAEVTDRTKDLQIARAIIKADLGQIVGRTIREPFGGPPRPAFQGPRETDKILLSFVRRGFDNPLAEARGSLQYVEYLMVDEALVRRARARLDPTPDTPVVTTVLLDRVKNVEVNFLAGGAWSPLWRADLIGGALPDAISLTLDVVKFGPIRQAFLTGAGGGS